MGSRRLWGAGHARRARRGSWWNRNQAVSQISRISLLRETTLPCSRTSSAQQVELLGRPSPSLVLNPGAPALRVDAHRSLEGDVSVGLLRSRAVTRPQREPCEAERLGDATRCARGRATMTLHLRRPAVRRTTRSRPAHRADCGGEHFQARSSAAQGQDHEVGVVAGAFAVRPSARTSTSQPSRRLARERLGDGGGSSSARSTRVTASMLGDGGGPASGPPGGPPSRRPRRPRRGRRRKPRPASMSVARLTPGAVAAWPAATASSRRIRLLEGLVAGGAGGNNLVDAAERHGLGCRQPSGGEDEGSGPRPADPPGQQLGAAPAGDDAHGDLGQPRRSRSPRPR